ncbi:unnamed protein product [Brassica oleracea]
MKMMNAKKEIKRLKILYEASVPTFSLAEMKLSMSYYLVVRVSDDSIGEAKFLLFNNISERLIRRPAFELVQEAAQAVKYMVVAKIEAIDLEKPCYYLVVRVSDDSIGEAKFLLFNNISERLIRRPAFELVQEAAQVFPSFLI